MGWGGGPQPSGPGGSPVYDTAPHCGACVAPVAGLARQCPLPSCQLPTSETLLRVSPGLWISSFHLCLRVSVVCLSFRSGQFQILLCQRRLVCTLTCTRFARVAILAWRVSPQKWGRLSEPQSSPLRNWAPSLPGGASPRAGTWRGLPGRPWKECRFPAGCGRVGSPGSVTLTGRAACPRVVLSAVNSFLE